jgi:CheY-like chemotaxis protein
MEQILLVEDDRTNRIVMATYLREAGYVVDEAEDGKLAWEQLKKCKDYALVITDRLMPNMDGLKLAEHMKANRELRHVPILMQTGSDKPEAVAEGIAAGVYYYLTKPYKKEALLRLVKAGISERRQHEWFEQRARRQKEALGTFVKGEFQIRTPEEAQNISFLLGNLFPNPVLAVSGLYELMLNAIEHGNLGIGFEEKAKLLAASEWEKEIANRLKSPAYADKKVTVRYAQIENRVQVIIQDEGPGFDWRPYLEIEPSRATQSNGRGIAKANLLSFDRLAFKENGNQVEVSSILPKRSAAQAA